jgi:ATP-dependent RNA helicase DDX59
MPKTIDEYIHQVGRAGRLGAFGISISFINESNGHLCYDLYKLLKTSKIQIPHKLIEYLKTKQK